MKREDLKEIVNEILLKEKVNSVAGIRKVYYDVGDGIQKLAQLGKTKKDAKIKELAKEMFKKFRELETYLDKEYEGWD